MNDHEHVENVPLIEDSLALDLANTHYTVRGAVREGLASPSALDGWLQRIRPRLTHTPASEALVVGEGDLAEFLALRSAIRSIAGSLAAADSGDGAAGERAVDEAAVDLLNAHAGILRTWQSLALSIGSVPSAVSRSEGSGVGGVLGEIAADAIAIFGTDRLTTLRACQAPGCPLFFLKDHPRREWCRPSCGTRVRAARAYRKRTGLVVED
ncbi:CGNR zinc finger domain-containing protein [Lacisediminihabitans changchengi]|uniref:CGNR zinc finger domain-containing protein n=1 Tax=Lacisediminihabitans changchengi TaxID=2787634 RepID=A0A934SN82_9MICO|nr:CGNR zinc finger domain-containing protein [Lacisediminihabitans changchengi]MBK4348490.1 CGNR zinc finger domain-containing protein [Lacisediminihabitans changchengi]